MQSNRARESIAGPDDGPEAPFPIQLSGCIIKGFGRGSKELGIPTANIPLSGLSIGGHEDLESGIYFGWASVENIAASSQNGSANKDESNNTNWAVFPMVMSIGWNPFYKNTVRSVEVHIIHQFEQDFYGHQMNLIILGHIRPEYDYVSMEALVEDINTDIEVTKRSLEREAYSRCKEDEYLRRGSGEAQEAR